VPWSSICIDQACESHGQFSPRQTWGPLRRGTICWQDVLCLSSGDRPAGFGACHANDCGPFRAAVGVIVSSVDAVKESTARSKNPCEQTTATVRDISQSASGFLPATVRWKAKSRSPFSSPKGRGQGQKQIKTSTLSKSDANAYLLERYCKRQKAGDNTHQWWWPDPPSGGKSCRVCALVLLPRATFPQFVGG